VDRFETLKYSDLLDTTTIERLQERKPDVFIHCGWRGVGGHERNEAFQITSNIPTTIQAVELAAAAGCRQWIGLGSQAEYGNLNRRISEDAPLIPTTVYGKAKLAAGVAALALCETRKMAGAWLRVFSTYGPGDAPHWFIPYVIQEFLADRTPKLTKCAQLWDYLFVGDAARAVASIANGITSGVFNLGSGFARPLKDIIEAIRTELGSSLEPANGALPYRPAQVMHLEADISRLQAATAWEPAMTLADGVRATVAYERTRIIH
jgi:nucleoside-diphosphate-sugar epimerase